MAELVLTVLPLQMCRAELVKKKSYSIWYILQNRFIKLHYILLSTQLVLLETSSHFLYIQHLIFHTLHFKLYFFICTNNSYYFHGWRSKFQVLFVVVVFFFLDDIKIVLLPSFINEWSCISPRIQQKLGDGHNWRYIWSFQTLTGVLAAVKPQW